ncbi:MAG: class D beta-lactamase [Rhodothermales bacterium]|nr:class D beta-lactamase [Rhodothermales bacterium]
MRLAVLAVLLLPAFAACRAPDTEGVEALPDTLAVAPRLSADTTALREILDGIPGAFAVVDTSRRDTLALGDVHARTLPASTYKIPHTLLALTLGRDTTTTFVYDAARDPKQDWWPGDWAENQTLATAFRRSVVWAYQDLARQIGRDTAQAWLDSLAYGNRTIGPKVDTYWLDGSLQISPLEQVGFVSRLFARQLPATPAQHDALIRLMRLRAGKDWVIYGKTGTSGPDSVAAVAWLVGALRVGASDDSTGFVYPFVLRIRPRTDAEAWSRTERLDRVERLLRTAGLIEG